MKKNLWYSGIKKIADIQILKKEYQFPKREL